MPLRTVLLSLGSNLEPRRERIHEAMAAIAAEILSDCRPSSLYETDPVGYTDQPPFINAALVGTTDLEPEEVHRRCKALEVRLGRTKRERWREREIDVDVILITDVVIGTEALEIPHPRMQDRRFVLQSCAEVAPYLIHPILGRTVEELLAECPDTSAVKVVDSPPVLSPHAHP